MNSIIAEECKRIFQLQFPPTAEDLKKEFRSLSQQGNYRHPDVGGTAEGFKELKLTYDNIVSLCIELNIGKKQSRDVALVTVQGQLLSSLGKGLDNTTNSVSCLDCDSIGYTSFIDRVFLPIPERCRTCWATGEVLIFYHTVCNRCTDGVFTLYFGQKVVCNNCLGTSKHTIIRHEECAMCYGEGRTSYSQEQQVKYSTCEKCDGKGVVYISNPVLQKGALNLL